MSAADETVATAPFPRWKGRLLASMLGTVLALGTFVLAGDRLGRKTDSVAFQSKGGKAFADLIDARREVLAKGPDAAPAGPWRWWVDERTAEKLFPLRIPNHVYDPYCYYRHKSHLDLDQPWPEHPNKRWHMRTNELGLREDNEVSDKAPDVRVLVTGDSHTDGVCDNSESFANVLEASLAKAHPGKTVDVLNAGKGGYGFYNYMGVLQRFLALDLKPRVFVVAVYGGNDFEEVLTAWHYFEGTMRPPGAEIYFRQLAAAKKFNEPCLAQGMMSFKYFNQNPGEVQTALDAALFVCGEILTTCKENGIAPVFVYVPSAYELDPAQTSVGLARVLDALKLTTEDLENAGKLSDRFLAGLDALGATTVDMRPPFHAFEGPLYWNLDHHMNVDAHALIARTLEPLVERLAFQQP
jgi:lysophospholipase L1-like esterase